MNKAFYNLLKTKGYTNEEVDEFEDEIWDFELANHIKCVLELDRREVFKHVFEGEDWQEYLKQADVLYLVGSIDSCVDFLFPKLSPTNVDEAKTKLEDSIKVN